MADLRSSGTFSETQFAEGDERGQQHAEPIAIGPRTPLGEYLITAPLGRGGFGTIWLARHRRTGEAVAIKVLHAELAISPQMVSRFEREARVISMLRHPNVVALHDLGKLDDGRPYLVMEYLPGISLSKIVKRQGPLPPDEALAILEPLARALAKAHEHGVIHRDVKASNVMICERAGQKRVVLLDFGVAKLLEDPGPRLTAPLAAVGSPHCMSPEQIRGQAVDARTDVYGLGTLTFYMLTGEPPFPGNRGEAMSKHLLEERPRPSDRVDITPAFDEVVAKAMSRDPGERFSSAPEFVAALRAAAQKKVVPAARPQAIRTLGLYIDVKIAGSGDDGDGDADDIYDDAERILPMAERYLRERGYLLVHEIGNSGLFVLPVPESADEVRACLQRVFQDAAGLSHVIDERAQPNPLVQIDIHLHAGESGMPGEGGSLLQPGNWTSLREWTESALFSSEAIQDVTPPQG